MLTNETNKNNKQAIIAYMQNHPDACYPYLVRGAKLRCRLGTHTRKLNLPVCHGVYTVASGHNHPMVHSEDAVSEKNIMYFGHCCGAIGQSGDAEQIDLKTVAFDPNTLEDKQTGDVKRDFKCKPDIIGGCWAMTHSDTKIVRNGSALAKGSAADSVTGASYLVCRYGGLIEPITSGQENTETASLAQLAATLAPPEPGPSRDAAQSDMAAVEEKELGYWDKALNKAILGDYADESNAGGIAGMVGLGFIPIVGEIADIRDFTYAVTHTKGKSVWENVFNIGITTIGFIPIVGNLKYLKHADEAADLLKHADEVGDIFKQGDNIADIAKQGDDLVDAAKDAGKAAGKGADDISKSIKSVGNNKRANDIARDLGYKGNNPAESLKSEYVGNNGSNFDIARNTETREIVLQSKDGKVLIPTGLFLP
jgi:hypothetical protein